MGACRPWPLTLWLLITGCGDASEPAVPRVADEIHGTVVARVDGDPIVLSEVQRLVQATDLSATQALHRLIDERVLAHYAAGRDYGQRLAVAREGRRAAVRLLLREQIEAKATPEAVEETAVAERFALVRGREVRKVRHVLFAPEGSGPVDMQRARHAASRLLAEARAAPDLATQRSLLEGAAGTTSPGLRVVSEELSFKRVGHGLDPAFASAVIEHEGTGLLGETIVSKLGVHVALVLSIEPAHARSLSEAEPEIRAQLSREQRRALLSRLLTELRADTRVVIREAEVAKALADPEIWSEAM